MTKKRVAQIAKPDSKNETADSPEPAEPSESSQSTGRQYGIAALFWITFLAGLTISYLQRLDASEIIEGGIATIVIGLIVGALIGWPTGNLRNAIFWGTLIAAFAYMSTAKDPHYDVWHRLAWGAVGATCGAVACSLLLNRFLVNAILCGLFAELVMLLFAWLASINTTDMRIDMYAAPVIGIAVAFFVRVLMWLESIHSMPRYITATWLMIAVILGNVFS